MVAWIHFLVRPELCSMVAWITPRLPGLGSYHGSPEKVPDCLDPLPCSLDLVPWLPGDGSWFLGLAFCFPGEGF